MINYDYIYIILAYEYDFLCAYSIMLPFEWIGLWEQIVIFGVISQVSGLCRQIWGRIVVLYILIASLFSPSTPPITTPPTPLPLVPVHCSSLILCFVLLFLPSSPLFSSLLPSLRCWQAIFRKYFHIPLSADVSLSV